MVRAAPSYSGHIRLKSVSCVRARFEQRLLWQGESPLRLQPDLQFGFEVGLRFTEDGQDEIGVELSVSIQSDEEEAQPYEVEIAYLGLFHLTELPEGLSREDFATRNAAAILFPYVRQAVTDLTSRGAAGPLFLPPVNVAAMLAKSEAQGARPGSE